MTMRDDLLNSWNAVQLQVQTAIENDDWMYVDQLTIETTYLINRMIVCDHADLLDQVLPW